ncbi:MAG: FAD-dependent oxidoreductase [Spirochaetales bacterium]|nr:FAD-dependent oxidoreductase [Spirochaetales bacterium]
MTDNNILFTPFSIGSMEIKNRIVQTSVEVGMAGFDGSPTDLLTDYYIKRVRGGVGLICTGICRINSMHGVTSPRQLSLATNRNVPAFKKMTDHIHEEGGKIVVQLHHPGRQTYSAMVGNWPMVEAFSRLIPNFEKFFPALVKMSSGMQERLWAPPVVSASALPCGHVRQKTRALRTSEVRTLVTQFVQGAVRAKTAGFDGVELHAAHGYLIQQFLSPATNLRTDCYGGSFENRFRFISEIIEGIRGSCGEEFPLIVRLTVDEYRPDGSGIKLSEGVKIAEALEACGVDALDISSGSYEQMNKWLETVNYAPGWRKHLAAEVRKVVKIPVIAANLIRSAHQAASQISGGVQDFIGLGRPLLADPELPNKIKEGREDEIRRCIVCCQCFESLNINAWDGLPLRCSVNPELAEAACEPLPARGKAVIIGGGPAGLQAALSLAGRGVKVVLFDDNSETGGQLRLAEKPPEKEKTGWFADDLTAAALRLGVEIRSGRAADAQTIMAEKPDGIILATGARPSLPPVTGAELPHVYDYQQILSGDCFPDSADTVAVIGSGMTGLETAEYLAARGKKVAVIEMADVIGPGAYFQHLDEATLFLESRGARFIAGHRLVEILDGLVTLESTSTAERMNHAADAVVLAVGSRPYDPLSKIIEAQPVPFRIIGDAGGIGKIADAVGQAHAAAQQWPF